MSAMPTCDLGFTRDRRFKCACRLCRHASGTTSHSLAAISPSALKRAKGALDFRAWREWNESRREESREEGCKESRRQEAGEEGSPRQGQEGAGEAGSQERNQD